VDTLSTFALLVMGAVLGAEIQNKFNTLRFAIFEYLSYLTHWEPHPTMVFGLGKNPARQRHTAAPLPPTEQEVLGPQGLGWQGSPWGRARAQLTNKLTAISLICN